jgi:NADH:ubiquinone oxidoreductase subunit 4 (subunit M)
MLGLEFELTDVIEIPFMVKVAVKKSQHPFHKWLSGKKYRQLIWKKTYIRGFLINQEGYVS